MKTTKAEISKVFAELRKWGFLVFNFNQKNRFGRGLVGFVDHLVIGRNRIWFIEVKIGKDKFSKEQEDLKDRISEIEGWTNGRIDYRIVFDLQTAKSIQEIILST